MAGVDDLVRGLDPLLGLHDEQEEGPGATALHDVSIDGKVSERRKGTCFGWGASEKGRGTEGVLKGVGVWKGRRRKGWAAGMEGRQGR